MSSLPSHILSDFADQARGLLERVERDLAEIGAGSGNAVAIEAAGRAAGALRSIRTGATFLELGPLAEAAAGVEKHLEALTSSGAALDRTTLELLRAAVDGIGTASVATGAGAVVINEPAAEQTHAAREQACEALRVVERKAPLVRALIADLAAAQSRLEGLAVSSAAGAMSVVQAGAIGAEGRDIRRIGRFFGIEPLEAIGAAVECAAPALARSNAASGRALPRLTAILRALVELTQALSSERVVRRDLTATCAALRAIAVGEPVARIPGETHWEGVLAIDADSGAERVEESAEKNESVRGNASPLVAGKVMRSPLEEREGGALETPEIDAVASVAAERVEAVIGSRNGTPDSVLSPLANVLTQADRVGQMARSIPREHADPIEAVRAVNRVADDLARASTELKRTVLASRARALHEVLVEGASLVANIAGQHGKDLRAEVRGGHIDIDEAVLGRLRQPLLAIVHRVAMDGVRAGMEGPVVIGLTADSESAHVRILVVGASAPGACIGEDLEAARAEIEAMGGAMEFTADPSEGPAVVLRVPTNLAFLDAMVVRIGETTCAIPTAQVEEVVMPTTAQITMVGTARAIQLRRATVPMLDGGEVLNGTPSIERARYVVVVRGGGRRVALAVDRALGRQQVVVRPVDPALIAAWPILSAASVADGSPAVVLDVPGLIRAAGARASVGVAA